MITITPSQMARRKRVLRLVARRPMKTVACAIQVRRTMLSIWLAERGQENLTVRTLHKMETWCAQQGTPGEHGGHSRPVPLRTPVPSLPQAQGGSV